MGFPNNFEILTVHRKYCKLELYLNLKCALHKSDSLLLVSQILEEAFLIFDKSDY